MRLSAFCSLALLLGTARLSAATRGESMGVFTDLRNDQTAPAIRDLGLGWVRIMYHWTWIEPADGKMVWFEFDKWMARAKAQHLKVLIVAQGSPAWANGGHGPYDRQSALNTPPLPEFDEKFARYVAGLVRHGADAVEVWNEPNGGFYRPQPDPARWARLVVVAADAVKAVNSAVPVISGGVCPLPEGAENPNAPAKFLEKALTAVPELAAKVDGVGHHPYVFANDPAAKDPLTAPYRWNAIQQTVTMQTVLARHGGSGKPFWFTEYGVPTGGPFGAVPPEKSGEIYAHYYEAFDRLQAQGIRLGPTFFWTLKDSTNYQKSRAIEGWEGVFDTLGQPKSSVPVIRARAALEN